MSDLTPVAYLPDAGAVPPWLRITFGVVVLALIAARIYLRHRGHRRRRR